MHRSYSNPIYDVLDESTRLSFSQPLMINIERDFPTNTTPLFLLAPCSNSFPLIDARRSPSIHLPSSSNHHNYVNQRIEDFEENLDPLYARPRKRCITLEDEPIVIPPKASRFSITTIQPERAQIISTKLPVSTVLSSNESTDEIDQFIARENDRVERVKLRRRQHQTSAHGEHISTLRPAPAFNNPNYVDMPILNDEAKKKFSQSILV